MQRCTNELYWMDQQAEERINYDWSNTNLDYPARQRQYEVAEGMEMQTAYIKWASVQSSLLSASVSPQQNFISKCLESKEATITKLNDDGEKLIAAEHPGKNVIEVQDHPWTPVGRVGGTWGKDTAWDERHKYISVLVSWLLIWPLTNKMTTSCDH